MKKSTIRNIAFAILGAFLLGLGIDLKIWSIGTVGCMLMLVSMCLAITGAVDAT